MVSEPYENDEKWMQVPDLEPCCQHHLMAFMTLMLAYPHRVVIEKFNRKTCNHFLAINANRNLTWVRVRHSIKNLMMQTQSTLCSKTFKNHSTKEIFAAESKMSHSSEGIELNLPASAFPFFPHLLLTFRVKQEMSNNNMRVVFQMMAFHAVIQGLVCKTTNENGMETDERSAVQITLMLVKEILMEMHLVLVMPARTMKLYPTTLWSRLDLRVPLRLVCIKIVA